MPVVATAVTNVPSERLSRATTAAQRASSPLRAVAGRGFAGRSGVGGAFIMRRNIVRRPGPRTPILAFNFERLGRAAKRRPAP